MSHSNPISVLFICPVADVGGAEHSLLELLPHFKEIRPVVMAPPGGNLQDRVRYSGAAFVPAPAMGLKKSLNPIILLRNLFRIRRWNAALKEILHREDIACVYANGNTAAVYAATASIPLPCGWHSRDLAGVTQTACRMFAPSFQLRVAPSNLIEAYLTECGIPAGTVRVVPNPVDPGRFYPGPGSRRRFSIPEDSFVAGMIAHIAPWKNHYTFIRAARELMHKDERFFFLIAGRDITGYNQKLTQALNKSFSDIQRAGRGLWLEDDSDMGELFRCMDLLVHPAAVEPFGRTIAEAAVSGVPVLCARAGSLQYLTSESIFSDPELNADRICEFCLAVQPQQKALKNAALAGAAASAEKFDPAEIGAAIENMIREIV